MNHGGGLAISASKLSAFTFITPLFGVVASYLILHDTLTLTFGAAGDIRALCGQSAELGGARGH